MEGSRGLGENLGMAGTGVELYGRPLMKVKEEL